MVAWELIITGCGTSHGNPAWGDPDDWSEDPRDHRRRSGAILKGPDGQVILIDAGPDLMHQLRDPYKKQAGYAYPPDCICRCDALLLTHDHADHCHGLNDLRHLNRLMKAEIPVYGNIVHLQEVQRMFPYCFANADALYKKGSPALVPQAMHDGLTQNITGLEVTSFAMSHGPAGRTTGFRLGSMAYLTDLKSLPAEADQYLQDVDVLLLDMLREEEHVTHLCWSEAQDIIQRIKPKKCILIHMGYEVRYAKWQERLPDGVAMACDGMSLSFNSKNSV